MDYVLFYISYIHLFIAYCTILLTKRNIGLMPAQQTIQNLPGRKPTIDRMSSANRFTPETCLEYKPGLVKERIDLNLKEETDCCSKPHGNVLI